MSGAILAPHNPEAEVGVIGACLLDPKAAAAVCAALREADLYEHRHQLILQAVRTTLGRGGSPDLHVVGTEMLAAGTLEAAGGLNYLAKIWEMVPTAANVNQYISMNKRLAAQRRLVDLGTWLSAAAKAEGADPGTIQAEVQRRLTEVSVGSRTGGSVLDVVTVADVAPDAVAWLWPGRIPRGKLTLLIGDPGQGKSYLTMDLAARGAAVGPGPTAGSPPSGVWCCSRRRTAWPTRSAPGWTPSTLT